MEMKNLGKLIFGLFANGATTLSAYKVFIEKEILVPSLPLPHNIQSQLV